MKIYNLSPWKLYMKLFGIILIILSSSINPISGINYQFYDDFEGENSDHWTFWATDFTYSPQIEINNSLTIEDGWLISKGDYDGYKENVAQLEDNTVYGAWSFDIYIPAINSESVYFDRFLGISLGELPLPAYKDAPNTSHRGGMGIHIRNNQIEFVASNHTSTPRAADQDSYDQKLDQFQHYDMIRTENEFLVFVDQNLIINRSISIDLNILPVVNYLSLSVTYGSGIRFDNIAITDDADGLLAQLPTETDPAADDPSNESLDPLYFIIGGIFVLITGIFGWNRIKKKN